MQKLKVITSEPKLELPVYRFENETSFNRSSLIDSNRIDTVKLAKEAERKAKKEYRQNAHKLNIVTPEPKIELPVYRFENETNRSSFIDSNRIDTVKLAKEAEMKERKR